jgi:hypothetical protein
MMRISLVIVSLTLLFMGVVAYSDEVTSGKKMKDDKRYSLYKRKCRSCHTLVKPEKHSDQRWEELIDRYRWRARLSDDEAKDILSFLQDYN